MPRTLITAVDPVGHHESPTLRPVRLQYRIVDGPVGGWETRKARSELAGASAQISDMDYRDTNDLVDSMQSLRVGDESLADALRFEGASMWQFLPSFIWPEFFRATELTKCLVDLVEDVHPDILVSVPSSDRYVRIWRELSSAVATHRGIEHVMLRERLRRPAWLIGPRRVTGALRGRWAEIGGRRLARTWTRHSPRHRLLFAAMRRHWVLDPRRQHHYDEQLSPLLRALQDAGWDEVVAVDCPYNGPTDLAILRERQGATSSLVRWRTFGSAGGPSRARGKVFARRCDEWWTGIRDDSDVADSLAFKGIPLFEALHHTLRDAVIKTLRECLGFREQARRMLSDEQPEAVIATYETGPYGRALLVEAARLGIPTFGLQHGMIFDNHYDYMHSNVGPDPEDHAFTIADRTCVWGSLWRRVLLEAGHYPSEGVVVTGSWRHDETGRRAVSAEAGRTALALAPHEERLILVCSAAQDTVAFATAAVGAINEIEGATWRIRPHPSEDLESIRRVVRAAGGPPDYVSRSGSLLDVLAASSVVISQLSTVVSEALLADRQVVIVDFANKGGWSIYKDSAACLVASSPSELNDAVRRIMRDRKLRARMAVARVELVGELFGPRDGRAAERVAAVVGSSTAA